MTPTDLSELAVRRAPRPPAGLVLARCEGGVAVAAAGPVADDDVFELGSITKVVTGLLLADAVVRGEVKLGTQLGECLPVFGQSAAIALGDLATHRAGLPRVPFAYLRRHGLTNLTDPYEGSTVEELLADLERPADLARSRARLDAQPWRPRCRDLVAQRRHPWLPFFHCIHARAAALCGGAD